jgi:Uncharacterized protein conserved in bacteria
MKTSRTSLRFAAVAALALATPHLLPAAERGAARDSRPASIDDLRRDSRQASDLLGATVKTAEDEDAGKVEDLFVDLSSGKITGVLLSSGGFLGFGDSLSVVPPSSLRLVGENELRLDLTKEKLAAAPRYERRDLGERIRDRWADARDEMRERRGAESASDDRAPRRVPDADNTARNRRDRDPSLAVDPLDHSNKRSDIEITARIRSALVANDRLSTNAKNVKIVTRDGQVTLRGPVASDEEKRIIAELAAQAAPGRVTDQLEVAAR